MVRRHRNYKVEHIGPIEPWPEAVARSAAEALYGKISMREFSKIFREYTESLKRGREGVEAGQGATIDRVRERPI